MILAAVGLTPRNEASAQGTAGLVSSIVSRMERNHRTLKSLRAGINMVKYNSQIRDEDKYSGVVVYQAGVGRNANVRVEWQSPRREILAVSNGEYTLYNPRQGTAFVGNARSSKQGKVSGLLDLINLSGSQLQARFEPLQDIREETLWGGVHTFHLKLVPKGNAGYRYAEIWVDDGGMPVQSKIVEKNDDSTTVRLLNVERNARVSGDDFRLQLDPGVKRIRG
jgi:outer membrane lipoprotein-sorting protein